MKYAKLGDLTKVTSGGTPSRQNPEYYKGNIPWVKTGDLKTKHLRNIEESISEVGLNNSSAKLFPKGTIILAMYGATIGQCSILEVEAATNQACAAIFQSDEFDTNYLYAFLNSKKNYLKNLGVGGAQPNISGSIIKNLQIPLPPLPIQRKIAAVLDVADRIRQRNKEVLAKYDQLAQSVFLEMFGDPVKNEKGWDEQAIIDTCCSKDDIKCGPFGTQLKKDEYHREGVPLLGIPQINSNFQIAPVEFVTNEKAVQLNKYDVIANDIVMSRKGNVGKCALYPEELPNGILHSDVLRLRVNIDKLSPVFLMYQFKISRKLATDIENISTGAIMAGINVGKLKNLKIQIPPLDHQNQFASIIETIEQQKAQAQAELDKSEELFQSLMQRAFKGGLAFQELEFKKE